MQQENLPESVQNLFKIGVYWEQAAWPDYSTMDIRPEHTPALILVVEHAREIWEEYEDLDSPEAWAPVHAWRALGQLRAVEAIPALLSLPALIEEYGVDIIEEELPVALSLIGPAAIPALSDYLSQREQNMWALLCAAEGLKMIAERNPQSRAEVVNTLIEALRGYSTQDPVYNSFLASFLVDLKAVEAAPLVEEVFREDGIDETVFGDWEDYQVGVGLLEKRITPPRIRTSLPEHFADGVFIEDVKAYIHEQRENKKEKNKRKAAKAMRAKNRKKKKKK